MSKSHNLLDDTKVYIKQAYDSATNEWKKDAKIYAYKKRVDERVERFLLRYFRFVIDTDFLSTRAKDFLMSDSITRSDYARDVNTEDVSVNINTTLSILRNNKEKLEKTFWSSMIYDIIIQPERVIEAEQKLAEIEYKVIPKGVRSKYRKHFILDIPDNYKLVPELDDQDFDMLMSILEPYSRLRARLVPQIISEDMIGYFNHLSLGENLSEKDKERIKELEVLCCGVSV